ncbi:hypothetical protein SESBI_25567 [Sesbania bispinosa]|nr:hypothetical protein SESBI_25567 [Sesbania bispinosa]
MDSSLEDSDVASSGAEESSGAVAAGDVEQVVIAPAAKKRRLKPEEIRTRGSGALEGYFIKFDLESKEEDDYDFFSSPWVESLVACTRSIYADEKTISAFVDSRDVVDGSSAYIRSLWDHRFDVGSVIDEHSTLWNDVKRLEKKGDRSAHLKSKNEKMTHSDLGDKVAILETKLQGYEEMKTKVVGLEGKVALLGQENTKLKEDKNTAEKSLTDMTVERDSLKIVLNEEKLKVKADEEKYIVDFQQLNSDAAQSYGLGFEQALIQVKHFNPMADISEYDPLKELVNGALIDLGDGEEEPVSVGVHNEEEVVDSQGGEINKPAEDSDKVGNEEQGDAPLQ